MNLDGTTIYSDTNWHHIAVIKKGSVWGLYVDGTQEAYVGTQTHAHTYAAALNIGRRGFYNDMYVDGSMDDVRIQHSNVFNASPQSDNSDTITVPTSAHTVGEGSTFYMPSVTIRP